MRSPRIYKNKGNKYKHLFPCNYILGRIFAFVNRKVRFFLKVKKSQKFRFREKTAKNQRKTEKIKNQASFLTFIDLCKVRKIGYNIIKGQS